LFWPNVGLSLPLMYLTVAADNLAAGLASAAFVAFLSSLTNVSFTAVQYAIFSSLMTLLPKVLGGYSGSIVNHLGYPGFFVFTTLIGVPVVFLVWLAGRKLALREAETLV
jgi:PAT family beta-lactamase induction signal transducer AmpG